MSKDDITIQSPITEEKILGSLITEEKVLSSGITTNLVIQSPIGVEGEPLPPTKTLITVNMSIPSTIGINHTFSGSLVIDFKEGGGSEPVTSGVEKLHTYTVPGTYIIEVSGDRETITKFVADNSKITQIDNFKTGLLTSLLLNDNLISGILDLSEAAIENQFDVGSNPDLNNVIFALSGNGIVTQLFLDGCDLNDVIDFSPLELSGIVRLLSNLSAFNAVFNSSIVITNFNMIFSGYAGVLDFTNQPIGGVFTTGSSTGITDILFSATGNTALTSFFANSNAIPDLDFSVFPNSDGVNMNMTSCSWAATEHDNQLINLAATGWLNGSLASILGNAARTAASDAAVAILLGNGWTLT